MHFDRTANKLEGFLTKWLGMREWVTEKVREGEWAELHWDLRQGGRSLQVAGDCEEAMEEM